MFPKTRLRRLRHHQAFRRFVRETWLKPQHLILPLFVTPGKKVRREIPSLPGQFQLSVDEMLRTVEAAQKKGIVSVLLFGLPKKKDPLGKEAYDPSGIIQQAIRALRKHHPEVVVMADLCFCEYTDHGHCGVVTKSKNGSALVDNDKTLTLIRKAARVQADAGVNVIAPSGMMDGAVKAIRDELDIQGLTETCIMAYSAKYASAFYGPFRDAVQSAPQFGDRRSYQMDPANVREALREVRADVEEGADLVMVKPALSYLDVIVKVREQVDLPVVAYNVSGEYAMVKAAEKLGWVGRPNFPEVPLEILTSIKRAGADLIITYHALEVASHLSKKS